MALVFLRDKFFKCLFDFAFAGLFSEFGGQSVSGTDPDFIGGICDDLGFDPDLAFQVIGLEDMRRGWSKLFQAV
jgi:hypothetical protein